MNVEQKKKRIFDIIQIGHKTDFLSTGFDIGISFLIILSIIVTFMQTFDALSDLRPILYVVEYITIIVFVIEYILRLWTAEYLYPKKTGAKAAWSFAVSFYGIVDLLTIISFFAPFIFSNGFVALKMLRVIRIFRLFRLNASYDAFNVIRDVLKDKRDQIISSVVLIVMLMFMSSLCMYSLEHEAQPENFANGFSGIWWSVSTLLTVGYGDIYPITVGGKIMAIVFAFLGVGMVAIPTGIISAGFVEYYDKIKMGQFMSLSESQERQTTEIYKMPCRVGFSNADAEGRLSLTGVMNLFQDCCTLQSEDLGIGLSYLKANHLGWIVTSYEIKFLDKLPRVGDEIVVKTWPYAFRGMLGYRNFTLETPLGDVIAEADSLWVLMDAKEKKPARLPEEMAKAYELFPKLPGEWNIRGKINAIDGEFKDSFVVANMHLDTNQHMNNAIYVEAASACVPRNHMVTGIRIAYKKEALLGEEVKCYLATDDDRCVVSLKDSRGEDYCVVEFID